MQIQQVVVTGQNQVELQQSEIDETSLGEDELLIEAESTFISAGTELANYTGVEERVFQPGQWCTYPWRSGYANVGRVIAVGSHATRADVGDRVFTYGNHASVVKYSEKRLVIEVPGAMDSVVAAASRMAGVATSVLIASDVEGYPWAAVFGLGAVGNLAAQALQIRGCRVIGIDPVAARRDLAKRCGIDITIGGDAAEVQNQLSDLTGGSGATITVDAVGHSQVVMQALDATSRFGQIILLGTPRAPVEGNLTKLLSAVHLKMITVRGALEWSVPIYPDIGDRMSQYGKQAMIFDWIQQGRLQIEPLISHRMSPQDIKQAYEGLLREGEAYTGVALVWK